MKRAIGRNARMIFGLEAQNLHDSRDESGVILSGYLRFEPVLACFRSFSF